MNQKQLTVATLVFVIAAAVAVNEMVVRSHAQDLNREVASFGQRYEPEQIKWEQELAKAVAQTPSGKTVLAAQPSISEKFLFEALEGHYQAEVLEGKLLRISVQQNQEPVLINTEEVLKKYTGVFKEASSFDVKKVDSAIESVILKNGEGRQIGHVTIRRNVDGRVVDIEIQ